jgi:hypothetical protein
MFITIIESENGPQAIGPFREHKDALQISPNVIPLWPDIAEIGRRVAEREAETLDALGRL